MKVFLVRFIVSLSENANSREGQIAENCILKFLFLSLGAGGGDKWIPT